MSRAFATLAAVAAPATFAHPGHFASAVHWHASDVFGLVALGLVATAAVWFTRGGK